MISSLSIIRFNKFINEFTILVLEIFNFIFGFFLSIIKHLKISIKFIFSLLKSKPAMIIYSMGFVYVFVNAISLGYVETSTINEGNKLISNETMKIFNHDVCMESPQYNNKQINSKLNDMNKYFEEKYPNASILYYDINTEYKYTYNKDKVYFGASLIKTLSALYIYERALGDEAFLDKKLIYTENHLKHSAVVMDKKSFGDQLSLRSLVDYSISSSDNIAYKMLLDYIGYNTLKQYGYSIGNKHTLSGGSINGNINLNDSLNYMKRLYSYMNTNGELGKELRSYFNNDYALYLKKDRNELLHKSGDWENAHHDIGIIEDKNPFIIVVLTNHGQGEQLSIKDISSKIYEFHSYYNNKKEQICNTYKN